jgi:hypothetical protein
VLTAELYPTRLRATAFGVVSACSRLAGVCTPFVAGGLWSAAPAAALGTYAAAAALCAAVLARLKDTGSAPMPDELPMLHAAAEDDAERRQEAPELLT